MSSSWHEAQSKNYECDQTNPSSAHRSSRANPVAAASRIALAVRSLHRWLRRLVVVSACCCLSGPAQAQQGALNDVIDFSGVTLDLVPYTSVPQGDNRVISMTSARPDDDLLYVVTQRGRIYSAVPQGDGTADSSIWFDVTSALEDLPGVDFSVVGGQRALQEVAFHPDFAEPGTPGYGKFYTTFVAAIPDDASGTNYLGSSVAGSGVNEETVLAEWTHDFSSGATASSSYRELFRISIHGNDHTIKGAKFNPFAQPGDLDYGLLYVGHGDGTRSNPLPVGGGQNTDDALGKILRIDPLQNGDEPYSVRGNRFATDGDDDTLAEVFAMGFRNPHNMTFNQDDQGNAYLVIGEIGWANIEEVNVAPVGGDFGGNFGWVEREGTFVPKLPPVSVEGVDPLPADDWAQNDFLYPVAQFDHDDGVGGTAIASSFIIRNGSAPELHNQLVITNFATADGEMYHADWDEMLEAHNQLADGEPPEALTQAVLQRLRLALDDDNNEETPPIIYEDFKDLIDDFRTDTRFGRGSQGELYISSKQNGVVYLVRNSLPRQLLAGDFNYSGVVDGSDMTNVWRRAFGNNGLADADQDGDSDGADFLAWQRHLGGTHAPALVGENSVPEPGTWKLAVAVSALLASRALRRGAPASSRRRRGAATI